MAADGEGWTHLQLLQVPEQDDLITFGGLRSWPLPGAQLLRPGHRRSFLAATHGLIDLSSRMGVTPSLSARLGTGLP